MKKHFFAISMGFIIAIACCVSCKNNKNIPELTQSALIPKPVQIVSNGSSFKLDKSTTIYINSDDSDVVFAADYLKKKLQLLTELDLSVKVNAPSSKKGIFLVLSDHSMDHVNGYQLEIGDKAVVATASNVTGLFYAIQTLVQIVPLDCANCKGKEDNYILPGGYIKDYPEYSYRAAMLDVGRHFFSVDDVKSYIDIISAFKMNYFHLHLSDDQGWRIEIKSWPKLTSVGSKSEVGDGKGGYFTQEDYKSIVKYASDRHITVIPEIDMPGHTNAALASYAKLNSDGKAKELYTGTEVGFSSLDVDNPITYEFIDDVISELAAITPGPYINIGGDESLATKKEDYIKFIEKVQKIVSSHGKTMIGWEEIANAKLDPSTLVGFWKEPENILKAAEQNLKVIMMPAHKAYLDMKYDSLTTIGYTWAGYIGVDTAYLWNPATLVPGIDKSNILGVEAPLWTETVTNRDEMQYMILPRIAGYAEIGWCNDSIKHWDDYKNRLGRLNNRFDLEGWNFYPSPVVPWSDEKGIKK